MSNTIAISGEISQQQLFKGDEGNPFLAPRGVFLINNCLMVTDTGQNRVFIWKQLPTQEYQAPDIVLGQVEKNDTGRNSGSGVSAATLQYPSGIWSDGQKLILADAWNHRVLIWHTFPTHNGQAADVVIGQPDFEHNQTNFAGLGQPPTQRSLNWPYGVFSDGKSLWIADTGNRRVLFFEHIPSENYAPADGVIGKGSFTERDYDHADAIWPYSVKLGSKGQLAIVDTQYYRVLLWHDWRTAFEKKADVVIGQADMDSNGLNQYALFPSSNTLSWCYDSCFYREGIWVADTGNSRVLWFDPMPLASNPTALKVLGKKDFKTGSENLETIFGTEQTLYWPFSLCIDGDTMALADTGNHRIVFYALQG